MSLTKCKTESVLGEDDTFRANHFPKNFRIWAHRARDTPHYVQHFDACAVIIQKDAQGFALSGFKILKHVGAFATTFKLFRHRAEAFDLIA